MTRVGGRVGLLPIILLTFSGPACTARHAQHSPFKWNQETELIHSDIVVKGTVAGYKEEYVPVQDYMPGDPAERQFAITVLQLDVDEVLKGFDVGSTIEAVVPGGHPNGSSHLVGVSYDYKVGQEVVLALRLWKSMRGGSFMLRGDIARFDASGGLWVNREYQEVSQSLDALRTMIDSAKPVSLGEEADIVVVGTVEDIDDVYREFDAMANRLTLAVSSTWKGPKKLKSIEIYVARGGGSSLRWWRPGPTQYKRGDKRVFFLKKLRDGYYPFAGGNGVLTVEGTEILTATGLRTGFSVTTLESELIGGRGK